MSNILYYKNKLFIYMQLTQQRETLIIIMYRNILYYNTYNHYIL